MTKPYASTTKVPVSQSQAEIKEMLRALGADRLAVYEDREENYIVFEVPPKGERPSMMFKLTQPRPDTKEKNDRQAQQIERSLWRALVLLVKAKKVVGYGPGLTRCFNPACQTLWEGFDPESVPSDEHLMSFAEPCNNCAFRKGSKEQSDPAEWEKLLE
jgi:hypothetical protein